MIVVEGPDGAGKSTLVRWICETFHLPEGKRLTSNRDEIYKTTRDDTWRAMYNELIADMPSLVWDRMGPYSDPIYAPLSDREPAFTPIEVRLFELFMRKVGLTIMCLPEFAVVRENVDRSHQMDGVHDNIRRIYDSYHRNLSLLSLRYDYEDPRAYTSVGIAVSSYLRRRKEREAKCSLYLIPAPSDLGQLPMGASPSESPSSGDSSKE